MNRVYFRCLLTLALVHLSTSDIYTSSKKIEDMVLLEEQTLEKLLVDVSRLGDDQARSYFSEFYQGRIIKVKARQRDVLLDYLKHPNGVYLTMKQFVADYKGIRSVLNTKDEITKDFSVVATEDDLAGARKSFIRLQEVYGLEPRDMIRGNYLGYSGPALSVLDAFQVGQVAFSEGKLNSSASWLEATLDLKRNSSSWSNEYPSEGQIIALLGRAHLRMKHDDIAENLFRKSVILDPSNGDAFELRKELQTKPRVSENILNENEKNFRSLCSLQNKLKTGKFDPRLVCKYSVASPPYNRFKQEVISISPYVCLYYQVITDDEGTHIIDFTRKKLDRGKTERGGASVRSESRTSELSFVYDRESEVVQRMGQKVAAITKLDTSQDPSGFPFTGEPFQVVNYGMGGHYDVHLDPFDGDARKNNLDVMENCGNRLATFLIYLNEVDVGGSTAFTSADLVVKPVKNMALFWYSFTPAGELENTTYHAACPVVIGHKWVTNKWIWTYGNTFKRRCGLTANATQYDIEQDMINGWV
ncbi:unnamed protein product [Lymnaea stagnalis]|uniref:procollagen-proline 4-dioxygenase n=1 Tax=Lymnaea stagnalis TaxID=6523 RepID=A0AAV2H5E6_LYMST